MVDGKTYLKGNVLMDTNASVLGVLKFPNSIQSWTNCHWHPIIESNLATAWMTNQKTTVCGRESYMGIGMTTAGWFFIASENKSGDTTKGRVYPFWVSTDGVVSAQEVAIRPYEWSDFVFADDYKLSSFEEIEEYYSKHKHLEGVPSAEEVKDKGINLGEMDAILLKKIEELTIYMVEMNKEVKELKEENKELKAKLGKK